MPPINLRAFPNQTAVSFWIIVFVILGVMVAASLGPSPILIWPTTLSMFILPVRALLARPEKEIKKRQDVEATALLHQKGVLQHLQNTVMMLATAVDFPQPIHIIIGHPTDPMYATGSWQRHYLIIGQDTAVKLYEDLQIPEREEIAKAALLHEIAHFLHRDVQRVGYTRELLRSCFTIIPWWMIFLLGFSAFANLSVHTWLDLDLTQIEGIDPLLIETLEPLFDISPERRADIIEKTENISFWLLANYITNAFWPITLMGFVLWLVFWRRMVRLQEHQADYFVQEILQLSDPLIKALFAYEPESLLTNNNSCPIKTKVEELWKDISFRVSEYLSHFSEQNWYKQLTYAQTRWRRWFAYHPTLNERMTFLRNPDRINEQWLSIALTASALVLTLEVLLVTPLISYHTSSYVVHFATLAIFALLSVWILPQLVQKKPIKQAITKILLFIYFCRFVWIGFNIGLILLLAILMPDQALDIVNTIVFTGGRFAGISEVLPVDNPLLLILSIIPAYAGLQIVSLLIVVLLLLSYYGLQRRVSRGKHDTNWAQWHWQTVIMLSIIATTLALTPLSAVVQGAYDSLLSSWSLFAYGLGISVSIYLAWRTKSST